MKISWKKAFFPVIFTVLTAALLCGCSKGVRHLTADQAIRMMKQDKTCIVLDVRTPAEYEKRHIPGAVLLPIEDVRAGKRDGLPDKNTPILIYCWTGRRAEDAAAILLEDGYKKVYEFGGMVDWTGEVEGTAADQPVEAASPDAVKAEKEAEAEKNG